MTTRTSWIRDKGHVNCDLLSLSNLQTISTDSARTVYHSVYVTIPCLFDCLRHFALQRRRAAGLLLWAPRVDLLLHGASAAGTATLIMSVIMMMMITLHYPSALYPGRQSHIAELAEVVMQGSITCARSIGWSDSTASLLAAALCTHARHRSRQLGMDNSSSSRCSRSRDDVDPCPQQTSPIREK